MANQELFKLENAVRKAESAWDRQMKRDGHLKKESRDISTADPSRMTPTARAFFHEYVAAKRLLDAEAQQCDLFGGTPADPARLDDTEPEPKKAKGKASHLTVVTNTYPPAAEVITPDGMARKIVQPSLVEDWRALDASESLLKAKPTAKVVAFDEQYWVVSEVGDGYVVLNRCIPHLEFEGNTIETLENRSADDWEGLLFRSGSGKSPQYVLLNNAQCVACVAGDPLSEVQLSGTD